MVRVSVAITHLPGRDRWLPGMLEAFRGLPVEVVEDTRREGCWPTVRRAWAARPAAATHHLVVSDDLLVCRDFAPAIRRAVEAVPGKPIGPFCPNSVVHKAAKVGGAWALTWKIWGVAALLPVSMIDAFLAHDSRHHRPEHRHDDTRLVVFAVLNGMRFWNTVPSLLEHDGAEDSTLGNHPPISRRARRFIGLDASPLRIDWTKGRDNPPCGSSVSLSAYRDVFMEPERWGL